MLTNGKNHNFLCFGIFVLNLYVIPKYGIVGAAFATGLVYVIYNFARTFYIYKAYGLLPFKRSQLKLVFLFFLVFALIEGISQGIPAEWMLDKLLSLLLIFIKCTLVLGLFVVPVIYFNMEPETANYFNKLRSQWRLKKS